METDYEGLAENIGIAAAFLALSDGIDGKRNSDCELLYEARAALQAAAEMQKRLKELEEHIDNLEEGWAEQNEEWEREVAGLSAENERLRVLGAELRDIISTLKAELTPMPITDRKHTIDDEVRKIMSDTGLGAESARKLAMNRREGATDGWVSVRTIPDDFDGEVIVQWPNGGRAIETAVFARSCAAEGIWRDYSCFLIPPPPDSQGD